MKVRWQTYNECISKKGQGPFNKSGPLSHHMALTQTRESAPHKHTIEHEKLHVHTCRQDTHNTHIQHIYTARQGPRVAGRNINHIHVVKSINKAHTFTQHTHTHTEFNTQGCHDSANQTTVFFSIFSFPSVVGAVCFVFLKCAGPSNGTACPLHLLTPGTVPAEPKRGNHF